MTGRAAARNFWKTVDWRLVGCYLVLVLVGIFNIYASIQSEDPSSMFEAGSRSAKQLMWFGISCGVGILILFVISPRIWEVLSVPGYAIVLVLLFAVIFVGSDIKGSNSWFSLGPVSFQPAEVSKITTSMLLATFMSQTSFRLQDRRSLAGVLVILGLPMMAILLENETGSMLVYTGFLFVLFREGMSGWILAALGAVILLFVLTLKAGRLAAMGALALILVVMLLPLLHNRNSWTFRFKIAYRRICIVTAILGTLLIFGAKFAFDNVLQAHQQKRIEVLLGLKEDILGAGYNVHQSMIAIGSGGLLGKGYLEGTQTAYGFVPEQSTDFIFCTVGEEHGFIGCTALIILYALLLFWIVQDAEESRESFTRIYGYCLASCLFMHLFINIGMTIGIMPVIGIPLPFISYGGSSLLAFTVMLFIFIALDHQEKKYF